MKKFITCVGIEGTFSLPLEARSFLCSNMASAIDYMELEAADFIQRTCEGTNHGGALAVDFTLDGQVRRRLV